MKQLYKFNGGRFYSVADNLEEAIRKVTEDLEIRGQFVPRNHEIHDLPEGVECQ